MTDDLKTLVAIREILGSALREMDTLSVGYRVNYLVAESEGRIAGAYGYIDTAIRQHEKEKRDDPKRNRRRQL